jgi:peptide deformylase
VQYSSTVLLISRSARTINLSHLLPIAQRGEPILQQRAKPVGNIHDPFIQQFVDNMLATMQAANGVGIAAPQVYMPLRIMIIASKPNARYPDAPDMTPEIMFNPEIVWQSAEHCEDWEGCLSVAGWRAPVNRAQALKVRYQDRHAQNQKRDYSGFVARIVQHEYDHLDGVLFPERLTDHEQLISHADYQRLMETSS